MKRILTIASILFASTALFSGCAVEVESSSDPFERAGEEIGNFLNGVQGELNEAANEVNDGLESIDPEIDIDAEVGN